MHLIVAIHGQDRYQEAWKSYMKGLKCEGAKPNGEKDWFAPTVDEIKLYSITCSKYCKDDLIEKLSFWSGLRTEIREKIYKIVKQVQWFTKIKPVKHIITQEKNPVHPDLDVVIIGELEDPILDKKNYVEGI